MFLCCYVVKLGKAKKTETKIKAPPKKWKYFRVFFTRQVMVACAKVIAFFGCFLGFLLVGQYHYKNRFFDDFEILIFSFFGQKSRVNKLATVGVNNLATFLAKILPRKVAKLLTLLFFTLFLLKLVFFFSKISFSLQKEEDF